MSEDIINRGDEVFKGEAAHLLGESDLKRIACLHLESLPEDILPMLGKYYLRCFYRFMSRSDQEKIFLIRSNDSLIHAICVLTFSSDTLLKRSIIKTLPCFLFFFSLKIIISIEFRRIVFSILKDSCGTKIDGLDPQITFIFTDPASRGNKLGATLLKMVEDYLKSGRYKELYVKTLDHPENRAAEFYKNNGFGFMKKMAYAGRDYLILKKELNSVDL